MSCVVGTLRAWRLSDMTSLDASGSQQMKNKFLEFMGDIRNFTAIDTSH